jgi:hypothetical protein
MKVLLDECVPQRLRNDLPGHECQSARYAGFAGLANGDLLAAAEAAKFDVLLTVDRGFAYEQHPGGRQIAILNSGNEVDSPERPAGAHPECTRRASIHKTGSGDPHRIRAVDLSRRVPSFGL